MDRTFLSENRISLPSTHLFRFIQVGSGAERVTNVFNFPPFRSTYESANGM